MMEIINSFAEAFQTIFWGNSRVLEIALLSLFVSGAATIIAASWGIPIAMLLGLKNFRLKFLIKNFFNTMVAIPTVALGLILFLALSRSGPLGFLNILYSPTAIIIGEAILVTPLIVSFATNAVEAIDPQIMDLAKTLGASESQASFAVLREALNGVILAVIVSFNRAISELGIALMVGGNIVLTTVIANEINRPEGMPLSITLTIILLAIVFTTNIAVNILKRRIK